ncbi:hypothetical protein LHYA1_G002706 [Lachnellula hyalina]|uniref:Uncharacterized protein n=1 Tax=Lachnellula hyalina TaxID=1316788 RepID=A0A8H8R701_9HELO|nr:uncharacterized protein LHYA1_G002706 [Lachnellula hyalina]TVY29161.1 hypothetical protein LHYA1_G002706 [Lachnellula hyalina]
MASILPETPGRGRSRFSKALPTAPRDTSPISMKSNLRHSPLPPLPKDAMLPSMSIRRRPVGASKNEQTNTPSIASVSSVYSDSPRSVSDSSRISRESLSGGDSESGPTPPLPQKDEQREEVAKPVESPIHILANPSAGFVSSPPRPEIWRRRSVRSDKSIRFPDLKLEKSNGSTTSPPERQGPPPERSLPAIPFALPKSTGRKPVPARPAPPQPEFMGNKLSKLKEKHARNKSNASISKEEGVITKDGGAQNGTGSLQNSPFTRLPTPDYQDTDTQRTATPRGLSPRTPHTPPGEATPELPSRSESRLMSNGNANASRPNFLTTHTRESSETLTITSEPRVTRSPQPQKPFTTSKILTPQPSPSSLSSPPLTSPLPSKIHFPTQGPPAPPGKIFPGAPLSIVQLQCYQSHRFMRSTKNTMCPTACMVCQRQDRDIRWRCSWCCLSACGGCMKVLASVPGQDLKVCLERLGRR